MMTTRCTDRIVAEIQQALQVFDKELIVDCDQLSEQDLCQIFQYLNNRESNTNKKSIYEFDKESIINAMYLLMDSTKIYKLISYLQQVYTVYPSKKITASRNYTSLPLIHGFIRNMCFCQLIPKDIVLLIKRFIAEIFAFTLNKRAIDSWVSTWWVNTGYQMTCNDIIFGIQCSSGTQSKSLNILLESNLDVIGVDSLNIYNEISCKELNKFSKESTKISKGRSRIISEMIFDVDMIKEMDILTFEVFLDILLIRYTDTTATDNANAYFKPIEMDISVKHRIYLNNTDISYYCGGQYCLESFGVDDNWCIELDKNIYLKILKLPMKTSGVNIKFKAMMKTKTSEYEYSHHHYFNHYFNRSYFQLFQYNGANDKFDLEYIDIEIMILGITDLHGRFIKKNDWTKYGLC